MKPSRAWGILAFAQPISFAILWSLTSASVRYAIRCHVSPTRLAYWIFSPVTLVCAFLSLSIALVFIGQALRNRRLDWGMRTWWATAILLISPILVPAYWIIHLRRPL